MKEKCSICGRDYDTFAFKGGFVCEGCLNYLKDSFDADAQMRSAK